MINFSTFLLENREKGDHIQDLHHSIKGKYTLHKKGDYHYAKNKYGEVTHTFYKSDTDHVVGKLKHEHDIHSTSDKKITESFLSEMSASSVNIHRGAFNEAMFVYHANGRKWIDDEHKKAAFHHKEQLDKYDPLEARRQNDRAQAQVSSFTEHAKSNGYSKIKAVHLTAKPGDIEKHTGIKATQQENPSDVVVHFHNKPKTAQHGFLGASLKSSSSKKIGFHNGGAGSVGKSLGIDLESDVRKHQSDFIKKKKLPGVMKQAAAKVAGEKETPTYRNNPAYKEALDHASMINTKVRDKLHQHYSTMKSNDLKEHMLKTYVKASTSHALPYVKTHGTGGYDKEASAHTEDPSDNETYHALRDAKKVHVEKSGGSLMSVHADGKRMFGIQVKHNNGPLTPIKILAQP
jgi:hypothetical protein